MPSHPKTTELTAILEKLSDAGVEFIVVGGVAAVMHGVPVVTNDLDIVHRRSPENVARLLEVLLQLDATMRYDFARRGLRPTVEMLTGKGHINISTSLGPIDALCELDEGRGYEELLPHCQRVTEHGRPLWLIDLPTLITVKTRAGRPKDRMALPILIATLQELEKAKRSR